MKKLFLFLTALVIINTNLISKEIEKPFDFGSLYKPNRISLGISFMPLRYLWGRNNINVSYFYNNYISNDIGIVVKYSQKESLANYYYGEKYHFGLNISTNKNQIFSVHYLLRYLFADVKQYNLQGKNFYSFTSSGYGTGLGFRINFGNTSRFKIYFKQDFMYQYLPFYGDNTVLSHTYEDTKHPPKPIWYQSGFGSLLEIQASIGFQFRF